MNLLEMFTHALSAGSIAALPLSLAAGLVAGMNPCCLALYPAAAAACCGGQQQRQSRPTLTGTAFVLGVALAIAALGVLAAWLGRVVVMGSTVKYSIALLPIFMGVYMFGWIRLPQLTPKPFHPGYGGAFGAGLLLSLVIGPCGTPVLASVLSFAAYQQSLVYGGVLVFAYGLGAALPVGLVGTASGVFMKRLSGSRFGQWVEPLVGGVLVLLGFYLLWQI